MNWTRTTATVSVIVLLVASATLGPVALVGTALSQQQPQPEGEQTARLDSGTTFWQGQQLWLWAGDDNASETWQLREWDGDAPGSLVTEFTLSENGVATLPTEGLRGQYVVVNENQVGVFLRNGTIPDDPTANDPSFEIAAQSLNASFSDQTVTSATDDSSVTDLQVRSNRGEFRVTLDSDQLSNDQLTRIFAANESDVDGDGDAEVVLTRTVTGPRDALDANFSTVSPGEYEIVVSALDADASASAAIEVREQGQQAANLNQSVLTEQRGDTVTFTLDVNNTRNATVTVGSGEVNYEATVRVRDVDGDGQVTLRFNTFVAGRNVAPTGGFTAVGPDEVIDYNLDTEPLTSPLAAGQYDVRVLLDGSATDLANLILDEPSVDSMQVWTAPDEAAPTNAEELVSAVSSDDTIARDDWAVAEVEASGLYGYLTEPANLTNRSLGLQTSIVETNPGPNVEPDRVPLDRVELFPDPENNTFYMVFDTNGLEVGSEYRVTFTATDDNPYFAQNRSVSANFSVVERQVTVGEGDGPVRISLDDATVTGDSTLAAGNQFEVRLQNTAGDPFLRTSQVTVSQNGNWSANFDLPERVENGTDVRVLVPAFNVSRQAVLVEAAVLQTTTTTTETTTETTTTTTTTTETTTEPEGGDGGIPGFGVAVALVALGAATLLALRRSR